MKKKGLKGVEDLDPKVTLIKETASVIPFLIKTAVICGIIYYGYSRYKNRFVKLKENSKYPAANITQAEAESRADALAGSIGWFSNDFDAVADQLRGLNYNGFIRLYNAFGHRTGHLLSGDLNLIEWIKDQFSEYEVKQLSALQNGAFFRFANSGSIYEPKIYAMNSFINQFSKEEADEITILLGLEI